MPVSLESCSRGMILKWAENGKLQENRFLHLSREPMAMKNEWMNSEWMDDLHAIWLFTKCSCIGLLYQHEGKHKVIWVIKKSLHIVSPMEPNFIQSGRNELLGRLDGWRVEESVWSEGFWLSISKTHDSGAHLSWNLPLFMKRPGKINDSYSQEVEISISEV